MAWRKAGVDGPKRRILVIAPSLGQDAEKYFAAELRQVINSGVAATIMEDGGVEEVYRVSGRYDIIWAISHGGPEGVELGRDEVLRADDIAWLVRATGARYVILNVCASVSLAGQVAARLDDLPYTVYVVGSLEVILDRNAFAFGSGLIRQLAEGSDIRRAFNQSPYRDRYAMVVAGKDDGRGPIEPNPVEDPPRSETDRRVDAIERVVVRRELERRQRGILSRYTMGTDLRVVVIIWAISTLSILAFVSVWILGVYVDVAQFGEYMGPYHMVIVLIYLLVVAAFILWIEITEKKED